jgi:hypothetical protein
MIRLWRKYGILKESSGKFKIFEVFFPPVCIMRRCGKEKKNVRIWINNEKVYVKSIKNSVVVRKVLLN